MIVTKLAIVVGVVVLGVLCWLAAAGVSALTPVLVTGVALVVLVGGGNYLGGRTPHGRPPGAGGYPEATDPAATDPAATNPAATGPAATGAIDDPAGPDPHGGERR